MRYLGMFLVAWLLVIQAFIAYKWGRDNGIAEGRSQALKTNPVSEELEQTCLGLWINDLNKKAWEKENK